MEADHRTGLEIWARERNLSVTALASRISETARTMNLRLTVSDRQLGRIIRGQIKGRPHPDLCRTLENMTGIKIQQLLSKPLNAVLEKDVVIDDEMIDVSVKESREHAMSAASEFISDLTVEAIHDETRRLARQYYSTSTVSLFLNLRNLRNSTYFLLEQTRRPSQESDLYLISAVIHALMASAAFDMDHLNSAMDLARASCIYGELVGNRTVVAWGRSMQSLTAYWDSRPREAVQYSLRAVDEAPSSELVAVRAKDILARALAVVGDEQGTEAAIRQSRDLGESAHADFLSEMGGEFSYSASRQYQSQASSYISLAIPDKAIQCAEISLSNFSRTEEGEWATVELYAHEDQAMGYVMNHDLDAANESLNRVWEVPLEQRRRGVTTRLNHLRAALAGTQWRHNPQADSLAQRAENYVFEAKMLGAQASDRSV